MPAGRPTNYNEEVAQQARDYLSDDQEKNYTSFGHAIPSIVGMCRILNRGKSTLYQWAEDPEHEFTDILRNSNELQELVTLNGSITGDLNPQIAKLVLGKHGYHDKQQQEISGPDGGAQEMKHTGEVTFVGKGE